MRFKTSNIHIILHYVNNVKLTVETIYNDIDSTINYKYKYGTVKDSNIVKPDTTERIESK